MYRWRTGKQYSPKGADEEPRDLTATPRTDKELSVIGHYAFVKTNITVQLSRSNINYGLELIIMYEYSSIIYITTVPP